MNNITAEVLVNLLIKKTEQEKIEWQHGWKVGLPAYEYATKLKGQWLLVTRSRIQFNNTTITYDEDAIDTICKVARIYIAETREEKANIAKQKLANILNKL